jgi:protein SCO1/2
MLAADGQPTGEPTGQPIGQPAVDPTADAARGRPRGPLLAALGVALLLAVVVAGALLLAGRGEAYAFNGGVYEPPQPAPPLDLTDQQGQPFSLADQTGKVSLVYFGYTTCPDLCPTTLSDFTVVKEDLGADAERVNFVLATFDPERDTQARLAEYLGFFDESFIGLRGDAAQTEAAVRAYGVTVKRVEHPESATGYLLDHTALVYLVDPEGRLRVSYPYGADPALIAEDVRHLLDA